MITKRWWEDLLCWLCDYWWLLLLATMLFLAIYFARHLWLPEVPLPLPATPTRVTNLRTGDVQITLTWASTNDLDLWVTDPFGESVGFNHKMSFSNGQLDVDANAGCEQVTPQPVENIFWPTGGAPRGGYVVEVQYYQQCETVAPIDYEVTVLVDGRTRRFNGVIQAQGDRQQVTSFER